jgi:hypothetical protein
MTESTPEYTDPVSAIELSSQPLRLSPENFHVDEQNRLVIDRKDLARVIQSQSISGGDGEQNLKPNVSVVVGIGISF